jgi:hypothetical protein
MSFQEKIRQRVQEKTANEFDSLSEPGGDAEPIEQSKFFGIERTRHASACLDLRLSNGNSKAIPYSYILEINFDASEGIEIYSSTKKITIMGRNLKMLYNYLAAFRVRYIQVNMGNDLTEESELFVNDITIEEA